MHQGPGWTEEQQLHEYQSYLTRYPLTLAPDWYRVGWARHQKNVRGLPNWQGALQKVRKAELRNFFFLVQMIVAISGKNCHCLGAWRKKKAWTKPPRWTPPSSSRTRWTTCCWTFPVGSLTMNAVNHRWSSDSRDAFNLYVHIQYVFERYHRFVLIGVSHFGVFVFTLCMCQVTIPSSTIARENIGRNWSMVSNTL